MKRGIFFALILCISFTSAIPTLSFQNEDINIGETVLATISTGGEFASEITTSDIKFYEGRKSKYFEYDLDFYNNIYYLYFYAKQAGDYSIKINDILYKEGDVFKSVSIDKSFTINEFEIDPETNETINQALGVIPGIVNTLKDSVLKVVNKGNVAIEVEISGEKITMYPSQTEEIMPNSTENFSFIKISSYKNFAVPVINPLAKAEDYSSPKESTLKSDPVEIVEELFVGEPKTINIAILNLGTEDVNEIDVNSDLPFLKFSSMENMIGKEIQNLSVKISPEEAGRFQGVIRIPHVILGKNGLLEIPLNIFVLPKGSNESDFVVINNSCRNSGGEVCTKGYVCNGESRFTGDGKYCCFKDCIVGPKNTNKKNDGGNGAGVIIAIIIIAGLGGVGFYIYKKQKKVKPESPEDKLKKSTENFEKKMEIKKPKPVRVKGNLSKS